MSANEAATPAPEREIPKTYDPRDVESRWYPRWVEQGVFTASDAPEPGTESFCIVIPPPNVTGNLHCGHALFATIQDVYTRHARMEGKNTLWLPGTDHAGIATQVVVERLLKREGTDRHALGRAAFMERVWKWKEQSGGAIDGQLRVLGASLDWERYRFTMDPHMSRAVREAFVRLYESGLIYRAERLVNWSPGSMTVLSDLEVDSEEEDGELFEFAYKVAREDGTASEEELVVATTRPETMLGDTAVAVHPDDPRYSHLHGKRLVHPFVARLVPVITDAVLVDPTFGTGAVKVTPAHDFNDFATGKRHGLPMISIFDKTGTMNAEGGPFAGLDRFVARKAVKKKLDELGLARGTKKHRLAVPRDQRTGTVIEPMLSTQWYVKADVLAKPAIEAVERGITKIVPEEWTKTYMYWMTNIQDWCISRQLWWGHQIPAWYCEKGHVTVAREAPSACKECGATHLSQDEDVLDTWFSSGLWPIATLGWPEPNAQALATFYPTSIMETGFDILFFWVARMMMMGIHFMHEDHPERPLEELVPFRKIYLHGMVTDENGDKMSKVKGNVIDPLDVVYGIDVEALVAKIKDGGASDAALKGVRAKFPEGIPSYGADALRWTLATYPPQQRKIPLSIKRIEGGRFLCNKLWNAVRFALPSLPTDPAALDGEIAPKLLVNRWILARLAGATAAVHAALGEFRLDDATSALYRFFWNDVCDWYLELTKPLLASSGAEREETSRTLGLVIDATLRLMHPFIPFVSEELWQRVPHPTAVARSSLALAPFPKVTDVPTDADAEREMQLLAKVIGEIRTIRSEHEVHPAAQIEVRLRASDPRAMEVLERHYWMVQTLAKTHAFASVALDAPRPAGFTTASAAEVEVLVNLKGLVDGAHELARIERELKKIDKDLAATEKKLGQPSFTEKAPPEVVAEARARLEELKLARTRLEAGRSLVDELG
jgi:valyl-tRNA synthetase